MVNRYRPRIDAALIAAASRLESAAAMMKALAKAEPSATAQGEVPKEEIIARRRRKPVEVARRTWPDTGKGTH